MTIETRYDTFGDGSWVESKGISDCDDSVSLTHICLRIDKYSYRKYKGFFRQDSEKSEVKGRMDFQKLCRYFCSTMELDRVGESFADEMFIGENNARIIDDYTGSTQVCSGCIMSFCARDIYGCGGYFFYQMYE
jgi:hypothetical protein